MAILDYFVTYGRGIYTIWGISTAGSVTRFIVFYDRRWIFLDFAYSKYCGKTTAWSVKVAAILTAVGSEVSY